MDNCFSLYSLRFHRGHEFSYDLEALANNYNLYQELMEFWKQEFINDIFTVKYENLIENLEIETTKILRLPLFLMMTKKEMKRLLKNDFFMFYSNFYFRN